MFLFNSDFYRDAEQLHKELDDLARRYPHWFEGTNRYPTVENFLDSLERVAGAIAEIGRRALENLTPVVENMMRGMKQDIVAASFTPVKRKDGSELDKLLAALQPDTEVLHGGDDG